MPRMIEDYVGKRITVMGLGRFGGGVGVTRFLAERGADVLVTDTLPAEELRASIDQLADLPGVSYRLGEHDVSDFTGCDLLVVNPAVKPDNRFVRAAREAGIAVTSEIRLLVKHLPNRLRTIGITGSAGKSTTTAMTAHILRKVLEQPGETPLGDWTDLTPSRQAAKAPSRELAGSGVWMGGNIGGSLLPWVEAIRDEDWVVLELSSFMLEGLREDEWSPHIAVITNISPNHLDWHGSMENYVAAKQAILDFQESGVDAALLHSGSAQWFEPKTDFEKWGTKPSATKTKLQADSKLPGVHNRFNEECARHACFNAFFYSEEQSRLPIDFGRYLNDFHGLPHRLEYIGEFGGVKCYNDSKSTTPEAARLAIESFDPGTVRVILGGYDKGSDFGELAALAAQRCAGVYTIGTVGDAIADAVEAAASQDKPTPRPETCGGVAWPELGVAVERCGTLGVAVKRAMRDARASGGAGEVLVLSPGCASWDQFANYEERGARFTELVKTYGDRS